MPTPPGAASADPPSGQLPSVEPSSFQPPPLRPGWTDPAPGWTAPPSPQPAASGRPAHRRSAGVDRWLEDSLIPTELHGQTRLRRFLILYPLLLCPALVTIPAVYALPDDLAMVAVLVVGVVAFCVGRSLAPSGTSSTGVTCALVIFGTLVLTYVVPSVALAVHGERVTATVAAVHATTTRTGIHRTYDLVDDTGRSVGERMHSRAGDWQVGQRVDVVVDRGGRLAPEEPDDVASRSGALALVLGVLTTVAVISSWLATDYPRHEPPNQSHQQLARAGQVPDRRRRGRR